MTSGISMTRSQFEVSGSGPRLDGDGIAPPVKLPIWADADRRSVARDIRLRKIRQQLVQAVGPVLLEVDVLETTDAEQFLEWLKAQRNDEIRVLELLGQILCDGDFFLHAVGGKRLVLAAQQHLHGAVLKRRGKLLPPARSWIEAQNIGIDSVAFCLQPRREPEREFIVAGRGLAEKKDIPFCGAYVGHMDKGTESCESGKA
jgi:hypothetical protein